MWQRQVKHFDGSHFFLSPLLLLLEGRRREYNVFPALIERIFYLDSFHLVFWGIEGIYYSLLSVKKILGIYEADIDLMWAPSGASWWAPLVGGTEQLAQRELDTNFHIQARTAAENKQITNNHLECQIWSILCSWSSGPCPEHISWDRTRTTRIALTSVE